MLSSLEEKKPESASELSESWKDIVKKYNLTEEFAKNLRDTVVEHESVIGMRLDNRANQVVEREFACKPFIIKLKTSNWGWMHESVPKDQKKLAKCVDGHLTQPDHTPQTEFPENHKEAIRVEVKQISLQEILQGIAQGDCEFFPDPNNPTRIQVKPIKNVPEESKDVVFSIDLSGPKTKMSETGAVVRSNPDKPDWWNETVWGKFEDVANFEFPAQYKVGNGKYQDLKIFAIPVFSKEHPDGKPYPVGKDNDGFLRAISKKEYDALPKEACEVVNTYAEHGFAKMFMGLRKLHEYFWQKQHPNEKITEDVNYQITQELKQYKGKKIERFGAGTPYDLYEVTFKLNKGRRADAFDNVQHSFENYNPGKQTNIDAQVLWVFPPKGEPTVSPGEKEHVKFLLPLCQTKVFHVNHNWDLSMDMWGQVVLKQLQANMPVAEMTFNKFLTSTLEKEVNLPQLKEFVQAAKNNEKQGAKICQALYNYFEKQLQQTSGSVRDLMSVYSEMKKADNAGAEGQYRVEKAYKKYLETASRVTPIEPEVKEDVNRHRFH